MGLLIAKVGLAMPKGEIIIISDRYLKIYSPYCLLRLLIANVGLAMPNQVTLTQGLAVPKREIVNHIRGSGRSFNIIYSP